MGDNGGDAVVIWRHPTKNDEVVIDKIDFGWDGENTAENEYFDITQPIGTPRPSVLTLRRDLSEQIERRQVMYQEFGLADMYFSHLNKRLDLNIEGQIQYLEQERERKGREKFNIEVAIGEIRTAYFAAHQIAYVPYAPEDFAISAFQWYETKKKYGASNSSSVEGEISYNTEAIKYRRERNSTFYELSNHLGNVLVTVTDMKFGIEGGEPWTALYYEATVVSANDYYPFGSAMAGRKYNQGSYRFGFNGMEKDDELKGEGNSYDFGARLFDSRTGRWLAVDPLAAQYPSHSPYNGIGNNPIVFIDPDGKDVIITITERTGKPTLVEIHYTAVVLKGNEFIDATMSDGEKLKEYLIEAGDKGWNRDDIDGFEIKLTQDIVVFKNSNGEFGTEEEYEDSAIYDENRSPINITELNGATVASARTDGSRMKADKGYLNAASYKDFAINAYAHEIGHWLGLVFHSDVPGVKGSRIRKKVFDEKELKRLKNVFTEEEFKGLEKAGTITLNPNYEETKNDKYNLLVTRSDKKDGAKTYNLSKGQIETILTTAGTESRKIFTELERKEFKIE